MKSIKHDAAFIFAVNDIFIAAFPTHSFTQSDALNRDVMPALTTQIDPGGAPCLPRN
jgi:hypothetical protein